MNLFKNLRNDPFWTYEPATGLLTRKEYADTEGTDYTYTASGQLATRTWARGVVTTYVYDAQTGELTDVTYSDSTPSLSFAYDRLGQQTTITDATGTRTFDYDPSNLQLTAENLDGTFSPSVKLCRPIPHNLNLPFKPPQITPRPPRKPRAGLRI
jgi:YD repeat-containing protein